MAVTQHPMHRVKNATNGEREVIEIMTLQGAVIIANNGCEASMSFILVVVVLVEVFLAVKIEIRSGVLRFWPT
jgi:hypothetical protein